MNEKKSSSGHLFTASQWQELEHQALIYKYMVSGIPIPSDLILPIRRSFLFNSIKTSPSLAFPPQSQLGWSCVQMGLGREPEDPEQGRCRRTDGKKWRCSKEAYPDSKYCERHMHRGKNRLRKQAEISPTTSIHTKASSSSTHRPHPANLSISTLDTYQLLNPYSSRTRPHGSHFSATSRTSNLRLNTVSFSNSDYRYGQRMKHLDGYSIFSDASGSDRENPLQLKPMGMSSLIEANQKSYSLSKEEEEERQRHLRHFFNERPQKNKESQMELEEENTSYTKTQTAISFPKWF
ncbi:hypothetical protein IEQ34_018757 [Dendrobium chrysotoxum]|uniref:Growth-regulating factor n=1 Tax=Dendrobium chrysotoxum TaxID=161865 RepID=A0AAV7G7X0_DENCH|nr:hypothetical protein IEQ34_018757 [Dendrobium chrysotoxum]